MDSPWKMGLDVIAFFNNSYQRFEKFKKTQSASGIMAGSIAALACLWITIQSLGFFGYGHVIGGYRVPLYVQNHRAAMNGILNEMFARTEQPKPPRLPELNGNALNTSIVYGQNVVGRLQRLEENLVSAGILLGQNTPAHDQYIFSAPNDEAFEMQADALVAAKASMYLLQHHCHRYGENEGKCAHFVSTLSLEGTSLGESCVSSHNVDCDGISTYRSIDGSCNNPDNPRWGSALTAYARVLFPRYSDGIQEPRKAERRRRQLPGPRIVSTTLSRNTENSDLSKTLSVMQWSQFIAHDLAHTPVRKMVSTGQPISCCNHDGSWPAPRHIHPHCAAIRIPESDPIYGEHYISCMNYVRSLPVIEEDCNFGPIEQMNQVSHFLDASTIYGSTLRRSFELRAFRDGKLRVQSHENHDYLPGTTDVRECLTNRSCYKAGDDRVNFEPTLAVMHTVWLREHNRIAESLHKINPSWSDEKIYQESRRIVIAEIQHITYNEWLPIILGNDYVNAIGLGVRQDHTEDYSSSENPTVSNEAATAVFRFFNSLKQGQLSLPDDARQMNSSLQLSDYFYKPRIIENDGIFDGLVRSLATQLANKMDINLVPDITHRLYKTNSSLGLDTISLDIQQGRDHGLPGYNHYRKYCGVPAAKKFGDFMDHIPMEIVKKLESLYDHPNDVDLIIGGMAERPVDDGLLGPTFRCLLSEQMARSRWTDRYFYDSANQPHPFTSEQLNQLRRVTLARIFCDNSNNVSQMQPNVFIRPQVGNEITLCDDFQAIPSVDLYAWAEKAKAYR
ncbi:peroxidase-like isoform X2 [Venturia canescens]|uniref:peroxidase-like isoform X2 n=1 Tax=Venturia canescens TaxID=32260 RepID=UPI001C9D2F27|nr:peroxidase-like isoform X2 [Venturia canescens]